MKGTQVLYFGSDVPLRVYVRQLLGNLAIGVLFITWLRIPDSHTWQFLFSMTVIAGLLLVFLWLHASTFQALRKPGITTPPRRFSYVVLALWMALWCAAIYGLEAVFDATKVSTRAGYWNSRLSPHLRHTFTYERLSHWQHGLLEVLLWWVLPTLLLPLIIESVARAVYTLRERATYRVYRRAALWFGTLIASLTAFWLTDALLSWHPGHSVHAELISLVFRIGVAYLLDIVIYVVLIAFIAQRLAHEHTVGDPVA